MLLMSVSKSVSYKMDTSIVCIFLLPAVPFCAVTNYPGHVSEHMNCHIRNSTHSIWKHTQMERSFPFVSKLSTITDSFCIHKCISELPVTHHTSCIKSISLSRLIPYIQMTDRQKKTNIHMHLCMHM